MEREAAAMSISSLMKHSCRRRPDGLTFLEGAKALRLLLGEISSCLGLVRPF